MKEAVLDQIGEQQYRVALVTGASSGIGQAIAVELGRRGWQVFAASRSLPDCFETPDETAAGADKPRTVRIDVNDIASVELALSRIIKAEGRLDCLVQSAGNGIAGAIEDTMPDELRYQLETNFFGAANLLPSVLKQMRLQKSGLIVEIGSMAGVLSIPFQAYYSASKAALAAMTLALGDEVRPWGIRCMLVQPGDTRTGFTKTRVIARNAYKSDYADRCRRSVERMAADEQNGITSEAAARKIVNKMLRRRPPIIMSVGMFYKFAAMASRLLPVRLVRWIVSLLYAG